jgi:subtilase family serine protease
LAVGVLAFLVLFFATPANSAERQVLRGHIPAAVSKLKSVDTLASTRRLNLVIALPLRNREALTNFLQEIYDPTSPNYHQYLTPEQFAERFGPTEQNYQAVMDFAKAHGLTVTGTHPNRTLLDVSGAVADVEVAFHVNLRVYPHPVEARTFYAPDSEPSIDLAVPVLEIEGLDDYVMPRPMYHQMATPLVQDNEVKPNVGSGPGGTYMGKDFRTAYVPSVALTGSGQKVGLLEFDGYFTNDPVQYAMQAGLTNTLAITNVLVDGFDGTPGSYNVEVALDIEMVMSMAPGAQIIVYEGLISAPSVIIDVLNRMATDNKAQQLSASWTYHTGPAMEQVFQQMAAQGQSFFNCSGDHGAYSGTVTTPADDPYITIVGGTTLTTDTNGSWESETAWNWASTEHGPYATGGGISTVWSITSWQQGIDMSSNQGSATKRNLPDVAMVADYVYVIAGNGQPQIIGGTSISAPLWAAFTALVNERATSRGLQTVGFINPALYAIGKGTNYNTAFHDITTGNNTNSSSPNNFFAVPGYDLCTGWGTPTPNLIDALLNVDFIPNIGWTLTSLPSRTWGCPASSADGKTLVVVEGVTIWISTTSGNTWRTIGPSANWRSFACSADASTMIAAVYNGNVYVSTNTGDSWSLSTPSAGWCSVACSANGNTLVAAQYWGPILVSTNHGATWLSTSTPGDIYHCNVWASVASSADGTVLAGAGVNTICVSTNTGATWNTNAIDVNGISCSPNGRTLYAYNAHFATTYISTNAGTTWVATNAPFPYTFSADGYRVVSANDRGVLISDDGGITWSNIGPRGGCSVACSADGTRLVAAVYHYPDGFVYTGFFPRPGPAIETHPANQTIVVGSNAVFSVIAVGPPPMGYQWSLNGTNIDGATDSLLILTNVLYSQVGSYAVQVSDAYGSSISSNATLIVQIPNPPMFNSLVVLSNGAVQVMVTGYAGLTCIETSTNLVDWVTVTNIVLTNAAVQFTDSSATNFPQRFYRARVE